MCRHLFDDDLYGNVWDIKILFDKSKEIHWVKNNVKLLYGKI